MQVEVDGKAYYVKLASEAGHPGLKSIFEMLANDEQKHYDTFKALKAKTTPSFHGTTVLADSRNVFQRIADTERGNVEVTGVPEAQLAAYREAQRLEVESYTFYEDKAKVTEGETRDLLLRIAKEEHAHEEVLNNVIEFVDRPNTWIDSAEFNHIGEEF
eukprot:TRINITY_DN18150_c0_g1_i1.p2 TRINITY_DN18150_c0_g1~~TRINITY_DN18150_c0_g1_i1.p2  ORF type:complete len:186 (-),score=71.73 TRINITY_DN18150_c0_g1_i1:64-540(-)